MTKLNSITDSLAGRAAMLGGAAFAAAGITNLIHSQRHAGSRVIGLAGHLVLSLFVVALVSIGPTLIALARRARPGIAQKAGPVAAASDPSVASSARTSGAASPSVLTALDARAGTKLIRRRGAGSGPARGVFYARS